MCRREALKMRQRPRSASGAEARSIVDDLNGTSELVPFPSPGLTRRRNLGAGGPAFRVFPLHSGTVGAPSLRSLQGRVANAANTTFCPFRTRRVAYAFVVPALRKLREGRGTHLCLSCQQDRKPGPAARSASGAEARSIVDDLNSTSELVPFPSPDLTRRRNLGQLAALSEKKGRAV